MVHICREMFDPEFQPQLKSRTSSYPTCCSSNLFARFGLFSATSDHTLYPSTAAFAKHRQAADLYTFLGKVVGKARLLM